MKDYEALSKKHFDGQAADYDRRDTYYYTRNGKISCRDIAGQIKELPYESLLDVLDKYERFLQANHYYAYIYLTGGEPLTHPDFFPLLKELRRKQFLTGFLTEFLTAFLTCFLTELLKDFLTDTKGFFRRLCPVEKPGFQDW